MGLNQIWILQESGTCLFHKKFDDTTSDENLISGFLSAVNSFVNSFGDEIKWIETNRNRFVFKMTESIIFVACTSNDENAILTYKRLNRISDHFILMFGKDLRKICEPFPINSFKKIAPSINRIFAIPEDDIKTKVEKPIINYRFDSYEARLLSFIRYRRKVSITDIVRFLKITDEEASEVLDKLELQRNVMRIEQTDGTEKFGLHPYSKSAF